VYAFVNANNGNVVLAMTVNPFTAPGINPAFSPDVLYQFKIDNSGDPSEDLVIQITFDPPTGKASNPDQMFHVTGPEKPQKTGAVTSLLKSSKTSTPISGPISNSSSAFTTDASTGIKVFAGARDDPFFFDFVAFAAGNKYRTPGIDFFAGVNVSIIAIELPRKLLTQNDTNNTIHVWATTSFPSTDKRSIKIKKDTLPEGSSVGGKTFVQFDRMGIPTINTVLINPEHKNAFNLGTPATDTANFHKDAVEHIIALGNSAQAEALASALLPDMLTLDVTKTTGFLNGRRPEDDVVDAELSLLTNGAVKGDNVNSNDVPFLTDFPFFAPPHAAAEGVPKRN
jgi:hypothetical protein